MYKLIDKLVKLIDLKSLMTIGIIGVFIYVSTQSKLAITNEQFMTLVIMVFTFYFAKKDTPKE